MVGIGAAWEGVGKYGGHSYVNGSGPLIEPDTQIFPPSLN